MCQGCVNEGHMTAEELTAQIAAGDQSVVVILALEPADFKVELVALTIGAILGGMDPEEAVDIAVRVESEYVRTRDLQESEMDDFLEKLAAI